MRIKEKGYAEDQMKEDWIWVLAIRLTKLLCFIHKFCPQLSCIYVYPNIDIPNVFTVKVAVALGGWPMPLSAVHLYTDPFRFVCAVMLRYSPLPTSCPFLVQVMVGSGFPDAAQWNDTLSISLTMWFLGSEVILGGTGHKEKTLKKKTFN